MGGAANPAETCTTLRKQCVQLPCDIFSLLPMRLPQFMQRSGALVFAGEV